MNVPRSLRPGSRLPQEGDKAMANPAEDDLPAEYSLIYTKSQPNRFAGRAEEPVRLADPEDEREPQGKSVGAAG
jgi:hypothetical protein